MKKTLSIQLALFLVLLTASVCFAAATKEEVLSKVNAAAEMIKTAGLEAALAKVGDKKGGFTWKDSYVFCMQSKTGEMLAHPYLPNRFIGASLKEIKDVTGKKYIQKFLDTAEANGQGWVSYERKLQGKIAYVLNVPEAGVVVAAAYSTGEKFPAPKFSVSNKPVPKAEGKRIAVIVAQKGFEDNEYLVPMELFAKAGALTTVFSAKPGVAKGMYGTEVRGVQGFAELQVADFDAVVFVGGGGVAAFHNNPVAHRIAREADQQGKVLSAICWAPVILANAGVLKGKEVTVNPIENDEFKKQGLACSGKNVSVDGKLVTANGPAASDEFGRAVLAAL